MQMERTKEEKSLKKNVQKKQAQECSAERRLQTEMKHQMEEAETRALGKAMMRDVAKDRGNFDNSCAKLLNNFQGKNYFTACFFFKQIIKQSPLFINRGLEEPEKKSGETS